MSFTDENISNQDLRAFTAPEVLQNQSLTSLSDVEKVTLSLLGLDFVFHVGGGKNSRLPYLNLLEKKKNPP